MMKTFLHVGCGYNRKNNTTAGFASESWRELRVDIDPEAAPDIVGSMLDMAAIPDESVEAVFSSHSIEHLYPHEVPRALNEFRRVLKPDGFVVIACPDLKSVCALVAQDKLLEPAYVANAGKVAPLDILYGFRGFMERGNLWMAHHCGFTESSLAETLRAQGFPTVTTMARGYFPFYDLWGIACKTSCADEQLLTLICEHFPAS